MSKYHTQALKSADIFTVMGSIYAEVARYDSAIESGHVDTARQASARAEELIGLASTMEQVSSPQKLEIKKLGELFTERTTSLEPSQLDDYLMPFAVGARLRQLSAR